MPGEEDMIHILPSGDRVLKSRLHRWTAGRWRSRQTVILVTLHFWWVRGCASHSVRALKLFVESLNWTDYPLLLSYGVCPEGLGAITAHAGHASPDNIYNSAFFKKQNKHTLLLHCWNNNNQIEWVEEKTDLVVQWKNHELGILQGD